MASKSRKVNYLEHGEGLYKYKGGYWERRETGQWSHLPSDPRYIFALGAQNKRDTTGYLAEKARRSRRADPTTNDDSVTIILSGVTCITFDRVQVRAGRRVFDAPRSVNLSAVDPQRMVWIP